MITELAILNVVAGREQEFEAAFREAEKLIAAQAGYLSHSLKECLEKQGQYLLLVSWNSIEDHKQGFRKSEDYAKWSALLHHFYDPFPSVEYYGDVS